MTNPRLIHAEWAEFERTVVPPEAGPRQRREMQKAFYAGALSLLTVLLRGLEDGEEVTPADDQMMTHVHAELVEFGEQVVREAGP